LNDLCTMTELSLSLRLLHGLAPLISRRARVG
jgi:hypothetical protein